MKIIISKDYDEMSTIAANLIEKKINEKEKTILGLATGSTPKGTYKKLIEKYKNNEISFEKVTSFNLDEYVGLDEKHKQSYRYFMDNNLFNHINIDKKNTFIPSGLGNIKKNAKIFEEKIMNFGPIDLQILGIGTNAHIGFNEPGSYEDGRTQEVKLTKSTIKSNKRFFSSIDEIPKTAISMGIGTILEAKLIILIASGKNKAEAIKKTIEGEITKKVPASFLQKHKNVTIIIDKEASYLLEKYL